jgi:hypothetical protein
MRLAVALVLLGACGGAPPRVPLTTTWPTECSNDYEGTTESWARTVKLRGQYQEILDLRAVFKSPQWRCAHTVRDVSTRHLEGPALEAAFAQAHAESTGPYEVELIVTTWDRRENDLDRGQRSVWRVVLVDDAGREVAPIEIVKDKRSMGVLRAEFGPATDYQTINDFAVAYIARFPTTTPLLGPTARSLRLRMTSERGGVEVAWLAP